MLSMITERSESTEKGPPVKYCLAQRLQKFLSIQNVDNKQVVNNTCYFKIFRWGYQSELSMRDSQKSGLFYPLRRNLVFSQNYSHPGFMYLHKDSSLHACFCVKRNMCLDLNFNISQIGWFNHLICSLGFQRNTKLPTYLNMSSNVLQPSAHKSA